MRRVGLGLGLGLGLLAAAPAPVVALAPVQQPGPPAALAAAPDTSWFALGLSRVPAPAPAESELQLPIWGFGRPFTDGWVAARRISTAFGPAGSTPWPAHGFHTWGSAFPPAPALVAARSPSVQPSRPGKPGEVATPTQAGNPATAAAPAAAPVPAPGQSSPSFLPQAVSQYANLGMVVEGRGELGGAWTRYRPCDPTVQLGCNPGLFPQLRPDIQFAVKVGGTISNRIHVDVDYDQRREFSAANNINVYYEGLPGEFLQRVEVGDVTFQLPPSRYLTQGIPGGNFGFRAMAQHGPLSLEAVFAEQKGDISTREFQLQGLGGSNGVGQDQQLELDGSDYVQGQFFFIVDPRQLQGYPYIDVLNLRSTAAPASIRPAGGTGIVLYRDERPSLTSPQQQAQLGYFLANAVSADGSIQHSGLFRRLVPGQDYLMHDSGLWLVLRSPLRPDESLAVGYVTASGDTVGAIVVPSRAAGGPTPQLRLLRGPTTLHQPGSDTWEYEMHQVYRVTGTSDIDPSTVSLDISLGEAASGRSFEEANGQQVPFLRLFGLDEDAPLDQLDASRVYQPGAGGIASSPTSVRVSGTFVIFPTLHPFAEPPTTSALTAQQAQAALGNDANPEIYDDTDPIARQNDSRFRLAFHYRVPVGGQGGTFNLGAIGIREGSERITVDGRPLKRGVDYNIDYDLGTVTLINPQAVLQGNPNAQIRATWEQKAAFDVAPTTLAGLTAHYALGKSGQLNVVGLYRDEKSLQTRPQLGLEPSSLMLGGVSGSFDLGSAILKRALSFLPLQTPARAAPSDMKLTGELALSAPDPNTRGITYLDDFEATDETPLSLLERNWRLGSRPDQATGAENALPATLDVASAAGLVWQHDYSLNGQTVGALTPLSIDSLIAVAGAQLPEPVLYMTFGGAASGGPAPPGSTGWRSLTTVLSPTGTDLSQTEYLEFYAAAPQGRNLNLVIDIGTIGEDAFYVDSTGATTGVYPDGTPWGLGVLDEEAQLAKGEVWGDAADKRGLWNQSCLAQPGQTYPLGDARADCTRGNGLIDTEDLDGNGILDANDGPYFRYIIPLDQASQYLVRDRDQTHTAFRLYRIPLRTTGLALNGANAGTWRFIKELRLTIAGQADATSLIQLARVSFIGSRWVKRNGDGVLRGQTDATSGLGSGVTNVRVGPVSRVTDGDVYTSPPGVLTQLQNPTAAFGVSGVEYNEKSLRIAFDGLESGDRAETYYRYPQQPRNLLSYRQLRVWAVEPGGPAAQGNDLRLQVRVGSDGQNYYLYQTKLQPTSSASVRQQDWLPERVIDFQQWFTLRARAEVLLEQEDTTGGAGLQPIVVWSADSSYAVVLQDRARAPNLAAVRELSFAVYNAGSAPATGEVWVDDLRLGAGVTSAGLAGDLSLDFNAGDFITGTASFTGQGALYRQLQTAADYQATAQYGITGTARLDRMMPASWGLDMPLSFDMTRTNLNPYFLSQSDVVAGGLTGLRSSGAGSMRLGLTLRRTTPLANPWLNALVGGTTLRISYASASDNQIISADRSHALDAGLSYDYQPSAHTIAMVRWTPTDIGFETTYRDHSSRAFRYAGVLQLPGVASLPPVVSPQRELDNEVRLAFRPITSLSFGADLHSDRDLLPPSQVPGGPLAQQAVQQQRESLAGVGVGWERERSLDSHLDFRPVLADWLRPGVSYSSSYHAMRNPSQLEVNVLGADTTALMKRGYVGQRQYTRSLQFSPDGLARAVAGDSAHGTILSLTHVLRPVRLTWNNAESTRFEQGIASPGWGFQLGLRSLGGYSAVGPDTAVAAVGQDMFRAQSGVTLPGGAAVDVAYASGRNRILNLAGGAQNQLQHTWPDVRFNWAAVPLPSLLTGVLSRLSLSAGYQQIRRNDVLFGGLGETQGSSDRNIPVQVAMAFGGVLSASYSGALSSGRSFDATGAARSNGAAHALQMSGTFLAPGALRAHFPRPFHLALQYRYEADRECRVIGGAGQPCAPYIDQITRGFHLTLDTNLSEMTVGLQTSYDDRRSFIGTQTGTSQFQLGIFGQFRLAQGPTPGGSR